MTVYAFLSYVYFLKMMYSQSDETGVLEVLKIIFILLHNHGGQFFTELFENSFHGFYTWAMTCMKLSCKQDKTSLNTFFYHHQGEAKISEWKQ